jgi:hypothetical protein
MECDYTHLNHNSLVSPKIKLVTKDVIIKGVYCGAKLIILAWELKLNRNFFLLLWAVHLS